jgi:ABC-type sugar transport system permease subunit
VRKESKTLPLMVIPALLVFSIFWLYPILYGVYISLFSWTGLSPKMDYVGLGNYATAILDTRFHLALQNTLIILIGTVILRLGLAFLLAWFAFKAKILGRLFYSVVFFPTILSTVIAGTIWKWMLNPSYGIVNAVLDLFGLSSLTTNWLGNPSTAILGILIASTWQGIGLYVILFFVGLQGIPKSMYYSARIDGLSGLQTVRHVVLPMLKNMITVNFILVIQSAFGTFDLVYIMTGGGPGLTTNTASFYLYRVAFFELRAGYAAAIGIFILLICLAIVFAYMRVTRSK